MFKITNLSIPLESNLSIEEAISKKGTTWYFCKYFNQNQTYTGYIYAPLCDCLSTINPNTETFEYLQGDVVFEQTSTPQTTPTNGLETLSSTTQTIIIVAVSLPCILIIYLILKPTKNLLGFS